MRTLAIALGATFLAAPAAAEVVESSSGGFATRDSAVVTADRHAVWEALVHPENWWSHTWSNDSANLSLDARAGGCFCETLPGAEGAGEGSVEHMRVIMVMPGSTLRMSGSLGPLQAEGLVGTLTVTLEEVEQGTRINWEYVTGGQARFAAADFAPVVDGVQTEFLNGLVERLGGAVEES
ncbi:SRPBCC family protein [Aurantiacibacter hainanensis]|uniref:SRPBCC family protein n=1 Tax=Aurantiacibacter hainanensis TaxID=3076114 RepID=UPI0030C6DCB6